MNYKNLVDDIEQAGSFHMSKFMFIALDLEMRSDDLEEIIDNLCDKEFEQLFPDIVKKDWYNGIEDMSKEDIIQLLIDSDKLGFIAEIGVHQRSKFSFNEDGSFSSCRVHTGMSYVKYAYGDTIEELLKSIESRCDEMKQYDIKKFKEESVENK